MREPEFSFEYRPIRAYFSGICSSVCPWILDDPLSHLLNEPIPGNEAWAGLTTLPMAIFCREMSPTFIYFVWLSRKSLS